MMILKRAIISPGLAGVDVANGRPVVFKPENDDDHHLEDDCMRMMTENK